MGIQVQLRAECEACTNDLMYWGTLDPGMASLGLGGPTFSTPEDWQMLQFKDPKTKKTMYDKPKKLVCGDCTKRLEGKIVDPETMEILREEES